MVREVPTECIICHEWLRMNDRIILHPNWDVCREFKISLPLWYLMCNISLLQIIAAQECWAILFRSLYDGFVRLNFVTVSLSFFFASKTKSSIIDITPSKIFLRKFNFDLLYSCESLAVSLKAWYWRLSPNCTVWWRYQLLPRDYNHFWWPLWEVAYVAWSRILSLVKRGQRRYT